MKWHFIFDKETANFLVHVLHKHLLPVQWSVALRAADMMYPCNTVYLTLEQPLGWGVISTQSSTHARVPSSTPGNTSSSLLWLHICQWRMNCTTHAQGPVVDSGLPGERGGKCQPCSWGCQPLFWPFSLKIAWNWKKYIPRVGWHQYCPSGSDNEDDVRKESGRKLNGSEKKRRKFLNLNCMCRKKSQKI